MKRKTALRGLLISFLLSCSAPSLAIYKCEADGRVSYSDTECTGGQAMAIDAAAADASDSADAHRQASQEKRQAERLANARRKREAQDDRERQRASRLQAAHAKQCAKLARRQKWADEDAAKVTGKAVDAARRKASRIAEEYEAECGRQDTLSLAR